MFVLALISLGLAAGAGTWWNYTQSNFSSDDAILRVMIPAEHAGSVKGERSGEASVSESLETLARAEEQARLVEAREEAEIELGLLKENLAAAKESLEQAVVMVREAKENFDFAADRHEKLMPLVETGALEPLAASQIQSAYISARAAFATAKFLLTQARQEYGSLEARRMRWELAAGKLQRLGAAEGAEAKAVGEAEAEEVEAQAEPEVLPAVLIEAWFAGDLADKIVPGMQARISLPSGPLRKLGGIVRKVQPPAADGQVLVILESAKAPPGVDFRSAWPVQVTIDASLPRVSPGASDQVPVEVSEDSKP